MAILLYFDTNVLCRPFDDQTIKRIQRETEAFEQILEKIRAKEAAFITSDILVFEIRLNVDSLRSVQHRISPLQLFQLFNRSVQNFSGYRRFQAFQSSSCSNRPASLA